MVKITYRSNVNATEEIVDGNTTIKDFIETYGGGYGGAMLSLNGEVLTADKFEKSFAELGVQESAFLTEIQKMQNA